MKNNYTISTERLNDLIESKGGPHISIHLPMKVKGVDTQQNSILLKNALRTAREKAAEEGVDEADIETILKPLEARVRDQFFWQHQLNSLSLFACSEGSFIFKLNVSVDEYVEVHDTFSVLPLLAELDKRQKAFVLQLSDNKVRLWCWSEGRLSEETVENLPKSREEALQLDVEKSLQGHVVAQSRGGGGPVEGIHGHGRGKDKEAVYRREFLQKVQAAVKVHLGDVSVPLIIATVERTMADYTQLNQYAALEENALEGNFDEVSKEVLMERLETLLAERHVRTQGAALASLPELEGGERCEEDLNTLLKAARMGQIERLYLPWPVPLVDCGLNAESLAEAVGDQRRDLGCSCIENLARECFRRQSTVSFYPADRWERTSPAVAQLRWAGVLKVS